MPSVEQLLLHFCCSDGMSRQSVTKRVEIVKWCQGPSPPCVTNWK